MNGVKTDESIFIYVRITPGATKSVNDGVEVP